MRVYDKVVRPEIHENGAIRVLESGREITCRTNYPEFSVSLEESVGANFKKRGKRIVTAIARNRTIHSHKNVKSAYTVLSDRPDVYDWTYLALAILYVRVRT